MKFLGSKALVPLTHALAGGQHVQCICSVPMFTYEYVAPGGPGK